MSGDLGMHPLIELAREIATESHVGQFRRDGVTPYIDHPAAVVTRVGSDLRMIAVVWLHDVLEDTSETQTRFSKKVFRLRWCIP